MSTPQIAVNAQLSTPATDPRIAKAVEDFNAILVPGERIEVMAVQRRLFALTHRRIVLAATTGRFIAMRRGLFGGYQIIDVRWQDLKDVHLKAGIFGANLTIHAMPSQDLAVQEGGPGGMLLFQGLGKLQAEQVYRACQANAQAWREKRRQRDLEEMRARAGGVQIGTSGAAATTPGAPADEMVERLERARGMLEKGLISDAEYEAIKAKVLGTL